MRRLALALLLVAGPALAGNDITGMTVQKYRNVSTAMISAFVTGNDDSSATLQIFSGWTKLSIDSGMVMVRRRGSTSAYDGDILWMGKGDHPVPRTCYFFIRAYDASGKKKFETPIDTVSNRGIPGLVATGKVWYVNQGTGSDGNNGLTPAAATLTIGKAPS